MLPGTKDWIAFIAMKRHCERILNAVPSTMACHEFLEDTVVQDATVYNLGLIGDYAFGFVSSEYKKEFSAVPWETFVTLRRQPVPLSKSLDMIDIYDVVREAVPVLYDTLVKFFGVRPMRLY